MARPSSPCKHRTTPIQFEACPPTLSNIRKLDKKFLLVFSALTLQPRFKGSLKNRRVILCYRLDSGSSCGFRSRVLHKNEVTMNSINGGACLVLLAFLSLAGCGTTTPETESPATPGLTPAPPPASAPAPLSERLSSAIRSAGPEAADTVKVTSIDGIVLLTGQVLSQVAKSQATNAAAFAGGNELRRLTNELRVVDSINISSAEQDARLAASVERILTASLPESAEKVRAVVDNARLYLVGRVSREEGEAAAGLVARLEGVESITTVFEYTD